MSNFLGSLHGSGMGHNFCAAFVRAAAFSKCPPDTSREKVRLCRIQAAEKEGFGTLRCECFPAAFSKCPPVTCRGKDRLCRIRTAEKEGFGTLRCECLPAAFSKCPPDTCIRLFKSLLLISVKEKSPHPKGEGSFLWRRRRDLNPRYPFGVYTISNRARSASYATSP